VGTQSKASVQMGGGGSCPCSPDPVWCSVCNDIGTNGGCPNTYTAFYSWWCCIGGAQVKCVDCSGHTGNCSCQYTTPISC
jgi:hypothetical protein